MFPLLLEYDPFTSELSPVLAKSRPQVEEITEGPRAGWTKYSYEILEDAVWDDGKPVTGADYLFTLKAVFNPHVKGAAAYRGYMTQIKAIELDPTNPKKFASYTDTKYINAEYATGLFVYPKHQYDTENIMDAYTFEELRDSKLKAQHKEDEKLKTFAKAFEDPNFLRNKDFISSCGAYQLEEWIDGERVVLKKKENWWGDKVSKETHPMLTAKLNKLIFKPISDVTTAMTLLKSKELDVLGSIPDDQFIEFQESKIAKESFNTYTPSLFGFLYLGMNTKNPKLSNKKTRQALAHLLDVDKIIKEIKPFAEPIVGPFHPSRSYYHKDLERRKYDDGKAAQLLAEAGWKDSNNNGTVDKLIDGEQVELELEFLIPADHQLYNSLALVLQDGAKKAGVRINVVGKAGKALKAQLATRVFDIFAYGSGGEPSADDPYQFWHTASDVARGNNRFGFGNAMTDKLIEDIRSELDEEKRSKLYLKFQEILYDEQPAIFIYATKNRIAVSNRFKNVKMSIRNPNYFANYWEE